MKNIIVSAVLICAVIFAGNSQERKTYGVDNLPNKEKIQEALGNIKYFEQASSNPGFIRYLSALESQGYVLADHSSEKGEMVEKLETVQEKSTKTDVPITQIIKEIEEGTFNILKYQFSMKKDQSVSYALGDSGKMITIKSIQRITQIANNLD